MKSDMYTSILNDIYDNKELKLQSVRGKKKNIKNDLFRKFNITMIFK